MAFSSERSDGVPGAAPDSLVVCEADIAGERAEEGDLAGASDHEVQRVEQAQVAIEDAGLETGRRIAFAGDDTDGPGIAGQQGGVVADADSGSLERIRVGKAV